MSNEANNEDAINAAQDVHNSAIDGAGEQTSAPVAEGLSINNLKQQVVDISQNSTGVAKETPQALPTAGQINAISSQPNTHATIVNPKTGLSHNPFTWFHEHVLSKVETIFGFITNAAVKTEQVIEESENSPTFAKAQANLNATAIALASAASVAVSEKLISPAQDVQTMQLLASLVTAVHTYVGILETEYQETQAVSEVPQSN